MAKGLTDIAIKNLKSGPRRREIPDPGARGLYVVVQPSGVKSFAVRYRFGGRNRKLTLQAGISLAAARKATADALFQVTQGIDPCATKRWAKQAQRLVANDTFQAIAEEYFRREGCRLRSMAWQQSALRRLVHPTLGERQVDAIRRSEIIRLLDAIDEGSGPVMADRVLAVIRRILNWHATRSDDFRSPIVRGMARTNGKERARERTLTDDELRSLWNATDVATPYASFIRFLLLTAARRDEAAHLRWDEIDGTLWTLPASRNKTKTELSRPLSAAAQEVLARVPRVVGGEFVFTHGRRGLSGLSHHKRHFDKASGVSGWRLHDLRRTARSLMSRAGVNADHAERALGHTIRGVRGVYDRHEFHTEKLHAFEALAAQIKHIVAPVSNVVSLSARG
jgi:integrase